MMEHTTDRLFWTLTSIIIGALILTIGVNAFPKMTENVISPMLGMVKQADVANSAVKNAADQAVNEDNAWTPSTPTDNSQTNTTNNNQPTINPKDDPKSDEYVLSNPKDHGFLNIEYHNDQTATLLDFDLDKLPSDGHLDIPAHIKNPDNGNVYTVTAVGLKDMDSTMNSHVYHPFADKNHDFAGKMKGHITSLHLPNTIQTIGWAAFTANHIEHVNIPKSVTFIGEWALNNEMFKEPVNIENPDCFVSHNAFSWSYENDKNIKIYQAGKGLINDSLQMD